ncbi:hypothetical protein OG715_01350 [Kitasatospora purpeofusca]|uniref:hypothetical protein n=1 Tax=Kitasatospora purpeofusca TaxID=67352 RepID=UPI002E0FDFC1|nr:hypothetical protein OG715_01350 [Kitasatospora purpeofusca]
MTGSAGDPPGPVRAARPPARALIARVRELGSRGFTGSVTASGGTIHLEDGSVVAVETPAAPTTETLLLKSRRVSEADWRAAESAASARFPSGASTAGGSDLGAALLGQGSIGAGELEVVCAAAAFDAAFALMIGPPGEWRTVEEPSPPARIALRPGIAPQELFEEATRRVALLEELWGPPAELARIRIRPAALPEHGAARAPVRYRRILDAATGRRTARDISFALGRGVFAVLLDIARMDAERLLHRDGAERTAVAPSVAPRVPPDGPLPTTTATVTAPLPRRVPGGRATGGRPALPGGTATASRGPMKPPGPLTRPDPTHSAHLPHPVHRDDRDD